MSSFALGRLYLRRGDVALAVSVLARGGEVACVSGVRGLGFHGVAAFLGAAYAWSGRSAEAISLLEPIVEQTAALGGALRRDVHLPVARRGVHARWPR